MNLLKAIYTFLKRISVLFFILFISTPLFSTDLRVAILTPNTLYKELIEDVITTYQYSLDNPDLIESVNSRIKKSNEASYLKQKSSYLENENFTQIDKLKEKETKIDDLTPIFVDLKLDEDQEKFLYQNDQEAIDYIRLRDNIDLLIIASLLENDVSQVSLYINGKEVRETLFRENLIDNEIVELLNLFLPILTDGNKRIYKINLPSVATLQIDGKNEPLYTSHVILEDGEHTFVYGSPGHYREIKRINVENGDSEITLNLTSISGEAMLISTLPFESTIFYNGVEEKSNLIGNTIYPFTLTVSSPGFSLYSLQSMQHRDQFTVNLKPDWIDSNSLIEKTKAEFYARLLTTLLSFGTYVGVQAGMNFTDSEDVFYRLQPFRGVTIGATILSGVALVDSMIRYYKTAKLGL